jgi:hypothetical protein
MITLPNEVMSLVNDSKASKTISTISTEGRRHTIYMSSLMAISANQLAFARILMKRTNQNLEEMKKRGDTVSVSVTLGRASYKIIAKVEIYQTSGPVYDKVIEALKLSGVMEGLDKYGMKVQGVWALEPVEVWNESPGPVAGTRVV